MRRAGGYLTIAVTDGALLGITTGAFTITPARPHSRNHFTPSGHPGRGLRILRDAAHL